MALMNVDHTLLAFRMEGKTVPSMVFWTLVNTALRLVGVYAFLYAACRAVKDSGILG